MKLLQLATVIFALVSVLPAQEPAAVSPGTAGGQARAAKIVSPAA